MSNVSLSFVISFREEGATLCPELTFLLEMRPAPAAQVSFPCMPRSWLRRFPRCQKVSCVMRNAAGALVDYTPIKAEINTAVQIWARSCNLFCADVGGSGGGADTVSRKLPRKLSKRIVTLLQSPTKSCEVIFPAFEIVGAVALLCCELLQSSRRRWAHSFARPASGDAKMWI